MGDHLVILALAIGGLIAFLVYKGTAFAKQRKEERRRGRRTLGFEPLDSPPAEVAERILAMHHRGGLRGGKLREVFERRGSADRFYLFDLVDGSGDGRRERVVAVSSPRLHLPRLTLSPRLEGDGRLAALGNLVLKKMAERHGHAVDLASHSRFARRHFVSGPDEASIRRLLNEDRLDRLAEMDPMAFEGEGGLFTLQRVRLGRRRSGTDREDVSASVALAEELLRLFATRHR